MKNFRLALSTVAALTLGVSQLTAAVAADPAPVGHIRGTLTKVSPTALTVATASGSVDVKIDSKTRVAGVIIANVGEITSGVFIGTANVPGAMSSRALEVVVFPKAMAGTGEGNYAWDLDAGKTHSSMTNGTVAPKRAGSMMTNATVTGVDNGDSKTVTLQYKGGSKKVMIAPGTPIVRAVPGAMSLLVAGAHVVTTQGKAGAAAPFVIVGEHGVIPPM